MDSPGNKEVVKETVMRTTLISSDQKTLTVYNARLNFNKIKNDRNIGFAHVVPDTPVFGNKLSVASNIH